MGRPFAYGSQCGMDDGRRRRYGAEEKRAAVRLVRECGRTSKDVAQQLGINPGTLARWVRADFIERRGQDWADRYVHS